MDPNSDSRAELRLRDDCTEQIDELVTVLNSDQFPMLKYQMFDFHTFFMQLFTVIGVCMSCFVRAKMRQHGIVDCANVFPIRVNSMVAMMNDWIFRQDMEYNFVPVAIYRQAFIQGTSIVTSENDWKERIDFLQRLQVLKPKDYAKFTEDLPDVYRKFTGANIREVHEI